ncbi:hypothetical protein B6D19_10990, partial [Gilliamella apicola]
MYHSLLPIEQHLAAERFLLALPDLVTTTPLCRRFKPASLFINIAPMTLSNQPHSFIADKFNLSARAARRWDNVIRQLLAQYVILAKKVDKSRLYDINKNHRRQISWSKNLVSNSNNNQWIMRY